MSFHEIRFPANLSFGSVGGPERRTDIVTLANGFEEIAASGVRFGKAHVLQRLPEEQAPWVEAFDFEVRLLSKDLAQVLYKAKLRKAGEMQTKLSLRSSLWQLNSLGWQMVFHQGTAVLPASGPV